MNRKSEKEFGDNFAPYVLFSLEKRDWKVLDFHLKRNNL
jgi:hypothetical protein